MEGVWNHHIIIILLTIGSEEEERGPGLLHPANLVYLLLDFQTLEVVELWLVTLEGAIDIVVTSEDWR